MSNIKEGSWLHDLIKVYNELGGQATYADVYPLARERRLNRGASWTAQAEATIRRTVEDHAESSKNFRGKSVFYSVNGHGRGAWALHPRYLAEQAENRFQRTAAYLEGIEGITLERAYLQRSRDHRLVQARKEIDAYTCQSCSFCLMVEKGKYVIDVHHLNPLGKVDDGVVTSVDDLVCLCPTCHRIAHSRSDRPYSLEEIRSLLRTP